MRPPTISDLSPRRAESVKSGCSVLIASCDAYADLWVPFFNLFGRYWPDCPYPVYLSSNCLVFNNPGVVTLNTGAPQKNWTNQIRQHLELLETPYVLMCLEDFFFRSPVRTAAVQECLTTLSQLKGHVMRLVCRPGPDCGVAGYRNIGAIRPGAPYRVSTQAAIWNRHSLLHLMREGESIWDFEIRGSERSRTYATGFYCVRRDVLTYRHHVVERGKWFPWAAWRFRAAEIGCDFHSRPTMAAGEAIRWCRGKLLSTILNWIPWPARLRLVGFLKTLFFPGKARRAR